MVTGAIIGGFTQVNLTAYPYVDGDLTRLTLTYTGSSSLYSTLPALLPNVSLPAASSTAYSALTANGLHVTALLQKMTASSCSQPGHTSACTTARRVIVSVAKCQNCHEQLGTNQYMDNSPLKSTGLRLGFHNGDRNDPTACNICHNGNGVDKSGFPYDSSTWYHGIHGASQRTVKFITEGASGDDFSAVLFPGQLKNCENCHLPNTANFGIAEATGQLSNKLWSYTATAPVTANTNVLNQITGVTSSAVAATYPIGTLLPASAATGNTGFSYAVTAAGAGVATYATNGALLNSPFASACSSCHDDSVSQNHIKDQGGLVHATHQTAAGGVAQVAVSGVAGSDVPLANTETCLTCHGQGRVNDAALMHQQR